MLRAGVRERMLQRLGELLPSWSWLPWGVWEPCMGRRSACLVQGSSSASPGKGKVEQPVLVRSCRLPTEPGSAWCQRWPLPWQEDLTVTGWLHQDKLWGATPPSQCRDEAPRQALLAGMRRVSLCPAPQTDLVYSTGCSPSSHGLSILHVPPPYATRRSFPGLGAKGSGVSWALLPAGAGRSRADH